MAAVALMAERIREVASTPPDWLQLKMVLAAETSVPQLLTSIIEEWAAARGHSLRHIDDQVDSRGNTREVDVGAPSAASYRDSGVRDMVLRIANAGMLHVMRFDSKGGSVKRADRFGLSEGVWLRWFDDCAGADTQRVQDSLSAACSLIAFLRSHFEVRQLKLTRQDVVGVCPSPPLAPPNVIMQSVERGKVADTYPEPSHYWEAFDDRSALNATTDVVSRQLNTVDAGAFAQRIFDAQWRLARTTSQPGLTRYADVLDAHSAAQERLTPAHRALWEQGQETLSGYLYDASNETLDVTAWAEPGTYVAPRDVAQLLAWRVAGKFEDDVPVKKVQVTFPTRQQAVAQARVLLDIGCQVFHYGETPADRIEVADL
jgi:hypothetical protein